MLLAAATAVLLATPTMGSALFMVGGTSTGAHPAVGALVVCSGESCASFCSGTLVSNRWVLTAGHCVDALEHDYGVHNVSFAIGSDVRTASGRDALLPVQGGEQHPRYHPDLEHDIGLVELAESIDSATQPVAISAPAEHWLHTPLRYVGYGVTSDEADDAGQKRRADIPLQGWDEQWLLAEDPEGNTNLCWGDSGGAAMMPLDGGGFALVGVQSWVWDDDDTPCTGGSSGAARVDAHLDWIESFTTLERATIPEPEDEREDEEEEEEQAEPEDEEQDDEESWDTGEDEAWDTGQEDSELPQSDLGAEDGVGTGVGGFQHAGSGCDSGSPRRMPWLPAILAVIVGVMLGRRRVF
jgi:hypothetical protein